MKYAPTQEDWLNELPDTVQKPTYESGCTLPLFAEEKPVRPQATDARQRLQQQLGKPESVRHVARRSHQNSDQTLIGDQERIAEHLSSAMALAESLQGRKAGKGSKRNGISAKPSYRQRKTTGVLICRHLVAALKLEVEGSKGKQP